MTFVITEPCIDTKDKSCAEECPVDCIYEGDRMMYIHPEECIDCGACVDVCPVTAIVMDYDLREHNMVWKDRNEAVFVTIGSPGGARRHGPLGTDHPDVAAVPPAS